MRHSAIWTIKQDSEDNLWIGTSGGLERFDEDRDGFVHFSADENDPTSLSHNWVTSIYEDKDKQLWIGTHGGGLNVMDKLLAQRMDFLTMLSWEYKEVQTVRSG